MESILSVKSLSKHFGSLKAVDEVDFEIHKGCVYGLLGPNGSGKSTVLGMVLSVVNPTSGSFEWFNGELTAHQALKKVGAIIERPNFYPYMTARQNLELVAKIKAADRKRIDDVLELVGLKDFANYKFKNFSLGMKQRLAIASALLNKPEMLILDEPTNGLDPKGIRQIRDLILEIASYGTTILLASHLLDEVEKVCSHVVILNKGKSLYNGKVSDMNLHSGYVELGYHDLEQLDTIAKNLGLFDKIEPADGIIKAFATNELDTSKINQAFAEKGIYLNHIFYKKATLEENFLAITQNL